MIIPWDKLEPDAALRIEINGIPVAVVRTADDEVFAVADTCSHEEESLSDGWVNDCAIECPRHGAEFDLRTGKPLSLPATDPIQTFSCRREGDSVIVEES